ncbi:hypothetical protein BJ944DRAFT_266668 [Cunninghamella echinulata]|nr:hypothetical protein BJ944DRAFT_266668 [Cunninghamella echinulata]
MKIPEEPTVNLIKVTNISNKTKEQPLRDFFNFCGKIKDLSLEPDGEDNQKALVLFETAKGAQTALLLSNALVDERHLDISLYFEDLSIDEKEKGEHVATSEQQDQESKPVSNIMTEILAAGYQLSDQVLAKGIAFDHKFGVREKVEHYYEQIRKNLQQLDQQYHVSEKATDVEQKIGFYEKQKQLTDLANEWFQSNPTGQKVSNLITLFAQQISDLNAEAKRIVGSRQNPPQQESQQANQ